MWQWSLETVFSAVLIHCENQGNETVSLLIYKVLAFGIYKTPPSVCLRYNIICIVKMELLFFNDVFAIIFFYFICKIKISFHAPQQIGLCRETTSLNSFSSDFIFNRMVCFVEQQVFVPFQMALHVAEWAPFTSSVGQFAKAPCCGNLFLRGGVCGGHATPVARPLPAGLRSDFTLCSTPPKNSAHVSSCEK